MRKIKAIIISFLATLPLPGIAMAAQFSSVAPNIEKVEAREGFVDALINDDLPSSYYEILEKMGIDSLDGLMLKKNKFILDILINQWEKEANEIVILASGANSGGGTGGTLRRNNAFAA